jgi:hypothetical protein
MSGQNVSRQNQRRPNPNCKDAFSFPDLNDCAADFVQKMADAIGSVDSMPVILRPRDEFHAANPSRWSIVLHSIVRIIGMGSVRIVLIGDANLPRVSVASDSNDAFITISRHLSASDAWIYFVDSGLLVLTNMCYVLNHALFRKTFENNFCDGHYARMRFGNGTLGPMVIATTLSPPSVFMYTRHEVTQRLGVSMAAYVRRSVGASQFPSRPPYESVSPVHGGVWRNILGLVPLTALPQLTDDKAMELLFESTFGDLIQLACEI